MAKGKEEIEEETRRAEHIVGLIRGYFPKDLKINWRRICGIIEWEVKQSLFQREEEIFKEVLKELKRAKTTTQEKNTNYYLQQLIYFVQNYRRLEQIKGGKK